MSSPLATRVFLSYRREETPHVAGRLADRLGARFGPSQVFMDVDTIQPGADFAAAITEAVALLRRPAVIIGRTWTTVTDKRGNGRLDNPDDFVVLEVATGLRHGSSRHSGAS